MTTITRYHCKACKVTFNSESSVCPLCQINSLCEVRHFEIPTTINVPDNGKDHTIMISVIEKTEPLPDQQSNIYRFSLDIPAKK